MQKYNSDRIWSWRLLWVSVVAYLLSIGIAGDTRFAPISQWSYDHIPFYIGLREPQKWIGLLMIAYCFRGARGTKEIIQKMMNHDKFLGYLVAGFLCVLPVAYTPTMLFGLRWQLSTVDFPVWRYEMREIIQQKWSIVHPTPNTKTTENSKNLAYDYLALPRHQYMRFSFSHKIHANPINSFFPNILVGDNMEFGSVYTQSTRPISKIIERYIWPWWLWSQKYNKENGKLFIKDMQNNGIKYIMLFKELERENNKTYIDKMIEDKLLIKQKENKSILLYKL